MGNYLYDCALYYLEMVKIMLVSTLVFGIEFSFRIKGMIGLVACTLLIHVISYESYNSIVPFLYGMFGVSTAVLLTKGEKRIYYSMLSYVLISLIDMALVSFLFYFRIYDLEDLAGGLIKNLSANSLSMLFVITLILIRQIHKKECTGKFTVFSKKGLALFIVSGINLGVYISVVIYHYYLLNPIQSPIILVYTNGGIFYIMIYMLSVNLCFEKSLYKKKSDDQGGMIDKQEAYFQTLKDTQLEKRKFYHDIIFHIKTMNMLNSTGEYQELSAYFGYLIGKDISISGKVDCGNNIVNMIINDCLERFQVCIEIKGKLPEQFLMDNSDVCIIFFNLFENAFYAAYHSEEKLIQAEFKYMNNSIYIVVRNSYDPLCEKSDGSQCLGVLCMTEAIQKHNGKILFEYKKDRCFLANIILPNIIQ